MIHNNEGYGVVLVKPTVASDVKDASAKGTTGIFIYFCEVREEKKKKETKTLKHSIHKFF